ncbi:MAG: galactosyldiacylglycerol synthase [Anaerolineales bacterium]|nr:MAG: galactosyldiacylglycerol synthase [Anaerolineales bacterium]
MAQQTRRLLFVFSDTGGGHRSTACAVLEALQGLRGELAVVDMVDGFSEYAGWPLNRASDIYPHMLRMGGRPWSATFRLSDGPRRSRLLAHTCWPMMRPAATRLVRDHQADAIVSFHPMFNAPILRALRETGQCTPLIAVVTDLIVGHSFWYSPGATCWLVPTEEGKSRALAHGLPAGRVFTTGLPVRSGFASIVNEDRETVRRRLGLREDVPVILLLSGAQGLGPVRQLCRAIGQSGVEAQLAVVAGRNSRLQSELEAEVLPMQLHVEGFVDNVHEWMRAADLLVTKAGPSSVSEALVTGVPMVISSALPGQEPPNVDYVVRGGAGVWAPTPELVSAAVRDLFAGERKQMARMAERARALGQPGAARRVADVVWRVACGAAPGPLVHPADGVRRPTSAAGS